MHSAGSTTPLDSDAYDLVKLIQDTNQLPVREIRYTINSKLLFRKNMSIIPYSTNMMVKDMAWTMLLDVWLLLTATHCFRSRRTLVNFVGLAITGHVLRKDYLTAPFQLLILPNIKMNSC